MSPLPRLYRRAFEHRKIRAQLALALALLAAFAACGPSGLALASPLAGVTLWLGFEYALHRFVLHAPRVRASRPRLRRAHDAMHYDHHRAPHDLDQLFISERGSVALAVLSAAPGLAWGRGAWAAGVALGFTLAMVQYGVAHLAAHTDYAPLTRWGRAMKRAHLWHHERDPRRCFGVLSPVPDLLAGTWIPGDGSRVDPF
ncbi:MAG: sterol desaturase family protein [Polyangiales bacterium]